MVCCYIWLALLMKAKIKGGKGERFPVRTPFPERVARKKKMTAGYKSPLHSYEEWNKPMDRLALVSAEDKK